MTEKEKHDEFEARLRTLLESGNTNEAAGEAIRRYGPDVFGIIQAIVRDPDVAGDVFGMFTDDLLQHIGTFAWRSSFRAWAYTIARHAAHRYFHKPHVRRAKSMATQDLYAIEAHVRTTTVNYMRTAVKSQMQLLREELEPDDQTLLVLRIDRELSWREVAVVFCEDLEPEDADVAAMAAKLRKRFQRLKTTLRRRAKEEGVF